MREWYDFSFLEAAMSCLIGIVLLMLVRFRGFHIDFGGWSLSCCQGSKKVQMKNSSLTNLPSIYLCPQPIPFRGRLLWHQSADPYMMNSTQNWYSPSPVCRCRPPGSTSIGELQDSVDTWRFSVSVGLLAVRVARPLHFFVDVRGAPFNGRDTAVHRMLINIHGWNLTWESTRC